MFLSYRYQSGLPWDLGIYKIRDHYFLVDLHRIAPPEERNEYVFINLAEMRSIGYSLTTFKFSCSIVSFRVPQATLWPESSLQ